MTKETLVQKFVDYYGLRFIRGDSRDFSVLMPYFIMDVAYQYYCHDILPMKCKQALKQAKNRWSRCYLDFNKWFTKPYSNDENIFLGDMIDEMRSTMDNELELLRISAMNLFSDAFNTEEQQILASVFMTNKLTVIAQRLWRKMHLRENNNLNGVMEWSKAFTDEYMILIGKTDLIPSEKKVNDLIMFTDKVIDKLGGWLTKQNSNESKSTNS